MYVPGTVLMWMAFLLGIGSTVAYALAIKDEERWKAIARQSYVLMTVGVVVASGLLMYLLITHDYRMTYVWAYSDNSLPMKFLVSSFWGGQEGSFLLWVFFGVLLGLPLLRYARAYESRVMVFYNLTLLSLLLLLVKQNPFRFHEGLTTNMLPMDGQGLNPLLQNPWMVIHPPIMFVGYASLSIPFAFALAALWMRRYDEWTKVSTPWVLLSFVTLGTAIMMGGYWAYETLGWGGYWGWDPVENASLVPWLLTGALTHGILLQRTRKRFRRLNLVLAVSAYLMVVYATFLTRSGVLSDFSVHSFVDLGISGWLVFNMLFFLILAIAMLAWRWREIPSVEGEEPFFSRTIFVVLGILMLILISLVVAFGTSAPLITRLWMESPAQVGPDFYNRLGIWLAIALAVALGSTPFLGWRKARKNARGRLLVVLAVTAVLVAVAAALGARDLRSVLYLTAVIYCTVANVWAVIEKVKAGAFRRAGGEVAHVGLGLMMLAFITTGWYGSETKIRVNQGESTQVLGYTVRFRGVEKPTPTSRDAMVLDIETASGANFAMKPRMWVNQKSNQLVANPDIRSFATGDLYIAPVEYSPGEAAPASAQFVLTKDETVVFRDWDITFEGFDMDAEHAAAGELTVGVVLRVERPGHEPVSLTPRLISTEKGLRPFPADIPGTDGGKVRAVGLSVDTGQVSIELLGLGGGVGAHEVLSKGDQLTYKDLVVTFEDFDLSEFDPDAGKIDFGVVFSVERDGETFEVVPQVSQRQGDPMMIPATIPGSGGMSLSIGRVSAEDGSVQTMIVDPFIEAEAGKPASLVIDVSTKPLIALVWIGTLLIIMGIVMAMAVRRREAVA